VSPAGAESWSSSLFAAPGSSVDIRYRLSYTGTAQPLGLASMYMQPTISNWRGAANPDSVAPFVAQGSNTSTPVGGVPDAVGQFGRILPYANRATNGTQALTAFVNVISNISYLRLAQAYATDWIGTGFNNTGGRGIPLSQVNNIGRGSSEPAFSNALQNIVIFKFRVNLSTDATGRTMNLDVPLNSFFLNTTTNQREVRWFATMDEPAGTITGLPTVVGANINVIPAPASLALMGVGALAVRRRHNN
jgi:hypothetical protein